MIRRLGRQIVSAAGTMATLILVVFLLSASSSPEAIARANLADGARYDEADIQAYIDAHGLSGSLLSRFWPYLSDLLRFDFGRSQITDADVWSQIGPAMGRSLIVVVAAFVLAAPLSLVTSLWLARRADSARGRLGDVLIISLSAIPSFVIGVGIVYIVAIKARLLPVNSSIGVAFGDFPTQLKSYVLPILVTAFVVFPYAVKVGRSVFIEVLSSEHVRSTVMRGLARRRVVWGYAVPAALVVMTQFFFVIFVWMLTGVIVVENVTGFPGIGRLLVQSVTSGDTYMIRGGAILLGAIVIVASVVMDLVATTFNPTMNRRAA